MSYKPKYCCECGEKVERIDWKPWTSKRFCELCATEHGAGEKLRTGLVVGCVLIGLAGLGSFWQRSEKSSKIPSNLSAANQTNNNKAEINQTVPRQVTAQNSFVQPLTQAQTTNSAIETQAKMQVSTAQKLKTAQTRSEQSPAPDEVVYFCGAQTKKGTACSRRVKGGGRCWQHMGQAAMLPQEKLIVSNN